jgi:DNA polymerase III delta' subunit
MSGQLTHFDQILGQDAAIESITRAYKLDRLPHGLIFAGPIGVGKAMTARALAGLFLCEKPRQLVACGKCPSCVAFDAGNHPDYHVIYRQLARLDSEKVKAKDLTADVVRDFLIAKAANKSVVGVGKVFVIEEADLMNLTAQNALLKTLEEPAGRTVIILLTDQPDALLPTIRSRCQLVRFVALDESLVREQLQKRGISKEVAASAATFSEGSLGLALRWIEDGVVESAKQLNRMLEAIATGQPAGALQDWFKAAAEAYASKQLERDPLASKDQATREGLVLYLKLCSQFFRRRLADVKDDPEALERTCAAIDSVVRAEGYLESNVNIPLVFQQFVGALEGSIGAESMR